MEHCQHQRNERVPLPKPRDGESKEDFLKRCMGNDTMVSEYSNIDQRYAICNTQWRNRGRHNMDMFFKTDKGYECKSMTSDDCIAWFKSHSDDEGNIDEDVLIFKDASMKVNTDKTISWTLSDDSIDRDFERFDTAGWNLKQFKKNPVLLWSHKHDMPAIGKVLSPRIKDNRLVGKVEFDQEDDFAKEIERKVRAGYINAGSVGFFPTQVEIPEDDKSDVELIYRKQELREFSICNVPANPNALVEPEKSANEVVLDAAIETATVNNVAIENIQEQIDDLKEAIETIKEVQMQMMQTTHKDDTNYWQALFNKEKPQGSGLDKLFGEAISIDNAAEGK